MGLSPSAPRNDPDAKWDRHPQTLTSSARPPADWLHDDDRRALGILDRRRRHVYRLLCSPARRHPARHKLLSSGATKGIIAAGSTRGTVVDPARGADPPRFWNGWRLDLLDAQGRPIGRSSVAEFRPGDGRLELAVPLPVDPPVGGRYELSSASEAPLVAIRYLLALADGEPMPPVRVRLGTTRGTNALLTRRGAPRRWSPRGASATCCRSAIKTGQKSSSWRSTNRLRCRPRRSRSTSGWPPTGRFCSGPTRRLSVAS